MSSANSPTSTRATSTRIVDSMLGMSPGEVRLLLLAYLCTDKKTGKMDVTNLAARARLTVPSARNMHRAALSKLAKLNPESTPDEGDDAGPSTGAASRSTPSRRGGRPRGRPRKNKDAATTTGAATTDPKSNDQANLEESEVKVKDGDEDTGIAGDDL
ncbi:uncharacterized protein N7473_007895 [Penicillium subrubescens]|uniref:Uncharacterized protein n=1 Tax=Penicillium subrubescens TaxID=1316194 RepID=A0A1Q5TJJ4_9EURO|nr:uncharacterized protein N7473_007895 [Penicillium subrubescens]KAJ5891667.1 hypothetical protein N7473_007895 [Penicillium subrubescens]OKP00389.1 hypothetical protein PENSUB_7846 [Penicillium subrubescens]